MAWDDDTYDGGNTAADDLQQIEDNFAAIKSTFAGTSAPANAVAGQLWVDTTNHLLKIRNEDNDAWIEIWDLANEIPSGQDFSDGSYLDGDAIDIDFSPSNYTADDATLAEHLEGIDDEIGDIQTDIASIAPAMSMPIMMTHETEIEVTDTGDSYQTCTEGKIYVPANSTTLYLTARAKRLAGNATKIKFVIDGNSSSASADPGTSYTWLTSISYDCSALSGWVTISIAAWCDANTAYLQGFSFRWS